MSASSFFRWTLPTWWTGEDTPPPPPGRTRPGTGPDNRTDNLRVLMVDDEELIRRLAVGMARRMNIQMVVVGTALEALQAAQAESFDVLVADVLLGEGVDGIALARQIAAAQPGLAVILMSGYSAAYFDLAQLPANTQFLTKPFSSDSLAQCLAAARKHAGE